MINRDTIEEIKNRIDIIDVVSDFITLKRSGQNYKALSPFTNEKTPSFYVVPSKGIFKDFSSGKGGDAITFVMEHEGMGYPEALRYLAKKYGVEIREDAAAAQAEGVQQSEREGLYIVMNFAKDHYRRLLLEDDEGKAIGLSYFRERGFNDRTIEKFELGYAMDQWDNLSATALKSGYSETMLEKSGLLIKRDDGKKYDRFRGRVIFPVHNLSGKVIAFGARILTRDKGANQPKYLNSPETEIYHKSQVLYGLFQAKNAIRRDEFCYLVEGYTDVISLSQAGVENVVSSSGTALTEDQVKLIRRFTENITVLYDGDAAGIKAALRGVDLILKGGLNVRIVMLPEGDDPDSLSRKKGSSELREYLKTHTQDFISFKIALYSREAANDPIRKAEAIREIVTTISLIPDPIKRAVYIQETSDLLKMQETVLLTELNKILIQDRQKKHDQHREETSIPPEVFDTTEGSREVQVQPEQLQEREMVRLLLNYADSEVEEDVDLLSYFISEFEDIEFLNDSYAYIYNTFLRFRNEGVLIGSAWFLENASPEVKSLVAELTLRKYYASPHWSSKYHIYFADEKENLTTLAHQNVLRKKYRYIQRLIEENKEKLRTAASEREVDELLDVQIKLKSADLEIAKELGIVSGRY